MELSTAIKKVRKCVSIEYAGELYQVLEHPKPWDADQTGIRSVGYYNHHQARGIRARMVAELAIVYYARMNPVKVNGDALDIEEAIYRAVSDGMASIESIADRALVYLRWGER